MKRKLILERKLTLTTEVEVSAHDAEDLEARTRAMKKAITTRGVKALPPVNWELTASSMQVVGVEDV
jgi:hypothetical protein